MMINENAPSQSEEVTLSREEIAALMLDLPCHVDLSKINTGDISALQSAMDGEPVMAALFLGTFI